MATLATSRNDLRLFIKRGLTVSEEKRGDLVVRGSGYSYILGSVYSKQMVKNLCTSQKYTSWSYFLTFTENKKQTFWNKSYSKMVRKKGWKDTYQ